MKKILLFGAIAICSTLFAQTAEFKTADFIKKEKGKAIVITLEGQEDNVEKVMEKKFSKLKHENEKGFEHYPAQIFSQISDKMLDYYWKVDKADKEHSTVILFISTGYNNFITEATHAKEIANAKQLLNNMQREVRTYELGLAIEAQEKVLEKAIKKKEDIVEDGEDLKKDEEKLKKELEENKQDQEENKKEQENQVKEVEKQTEVLNQLRSKLKDLN